MSNDGYKFDKDEPTQAEIASPAVDHFTDLMEGDRDAEVEAAAEQNAFREAVMAERMRPRHHVVKDLTYGLVKGLNETISKMEDRVLIREMQLALAQVFCNITTHELSSCGFDEFFVAQQQNMNVIGTMGDYVLGLVPSTDQLAEADAATEKVQ